MLPMPRRSFLAASLSLIPLGALAQIKVSGPRRAPSSARPLLIAPGAEEPVRLQSVSVTAEIAGGLAATRIEMVFFNPNSRILEGELQFPLLEGQSIAGFALDVDGRLRDAVPVEKSRGQAVFEDVSRTRVDPGLLEVTQGNNFKLRVYPLNPGGTRTVVLRYTEALAASGARSLYRLPLAFAAPAASVAVEFRVKSDEAPVLVAGAASKPQFQVAGGEWMARLDRGELTGAALALETSAPRGALVHTQAFRGETYFYAELPVRWDSAPRKGPRSVALAWDSSGSGALRDHALELALLDVYFGWMRDGEVLLVRLRDRAEAPERHRIADGDWRSLRRALETTAYDGATQLGAFVAPARADEVLLFSDGLSNYGEARLRAPGKPLHAICAAPKSDAAMLRALAESSGGQYHDLLAGSPREAAERLLRQWTRVRALAADGASGLVRESAYPRDGRVAVAGVLQRAQATIRVELVSAAGQKTAVSVPVDASGAPGSLAAGLWARLRVAELEADYARNRGEIQRLGRDFGLVTRETSLIVLERVADYARHEIEPPQELRADYKRLVQLAQRQRENDRRANVDRVATLLDEKERWWRRDFSKDETPIAREKQAESRPDGYQPARPAAPAPALETRRQASSAQEATLANSAIGAVAGARVAQSLDQAAVAGPSGSSAISIKLKPWVPNAEYARRMRAAPGKDSYRVYLEERPAYAASTAFFLDAADLLFQKGEEELALRVLSNLAEMDLENRHILRILGYRLLQAREPSAATGVFRKVLELAPEEPQSWRDLGLALAADRQYQEAADTLYEVAARRWDGRFPEIELITLADLNAIVAAAGGELELATMDKRLLRNLPLDLRAVLTWDADNTDIDLWVTDPNGERCFYGHRFTRQGGRMSQDFTGGYGPEEFSLKRAKPGKYRVEAQFYGHRQQIIAGATTLQVRLTTRFGTAHAQDKLITLRLAGQSEVVHVGEFEVS